MSYKTMLGMLVAVQLVQRITPKEEAPEANNYNDNLNYRRFDYDID